jgi:protein TonB
MRSKNPFFAALAALTLAACSSVPVPSLPGLPDRESEGPGPFFPRDDYPVPPNVARLIGPEDCRGSTLAAVEANLPAYPARAYSRGRQGWVVVRFHVYDDGSVHRPRIARAVPDGPFNRASLRAVSDWQFRPLDGVDVLQNCVVMFEYRMGEVRIR